jgi:hypothetical protein
MNKNNEVQGYYLYYQVDKKDKKNNVYAVEIFDNGMNKTGAFEVTKDKKWILYEISFNGERFMFSYYANRSIEYDMYDLKGTKVGTLLMTKDELSKYEGMLIEQSLQNPDNENAHCFPLSDAGFVKVNRIDAGKKNGYLVTALDNSLKKIWTFSTKDNSDLNEAADIITANDKIVSLNVGRQKSAFSKVDYTLVVLDAKTGKELVSDDFSEKSGKLSMLSCNWDEDTKTILVSGEVYAPDAEPFKDPSVGIFLKQYDTSGKELAMNKYLWEKEIKKVKTAKMTEEQKETERKSALYVHKVVRSKDGTLSFVCEQYRKSVSGLGAAGAVLSRGATSAMKIVLGNMVVMQFNKDWTIRDYQIIEKKNKDVLLPGGYGFLSAAVLANIIKVWGEFDYTFTSADPSADKYTVIYTDANRREEGSKAKSDAMLGVININGGKITTNRVPIDFTASTTALRPGKPGYIAIMEFFRKNKEVKIRLENVKY